MPYRITSRSPFSVANDLLAAMPDGLVIPFALAAGLSVVSASGVFIFTVAFAVAGMLGVALGLGAYLVRRTARSKQSHDHTHRPTKRRDPAQLYARLGLTQALHHQVMTEVARDQQEWDERLDINASQTRDERHIPAHASIIFVAYVTAALVPLLPFLLTNESRSGLGLSAILTLSLLLVLGYIKGRLSGKKGFGSAIRFAAAGAVAAACAFAVAHIFL